MPEDEVERQGELDALEILDSPPEPEFDRITRIARLVTGADAAFITLVDRDRVWVKSGTALVPSETPRDSTLCAEAILGDELFVVADMLASVRPVAPGLGDGYRSYAGAPLLRPGGSAFGTLCVLGSAARETFSDVERRVLKELAEVVVHQMIGRAAQRRDEKAHREQAHKETVRLKLQDAVRHAQSIFIAGAEPDRVFGELAEHITAATGSKTGCIAELAESGPLKQPALIVRGGSGEEELRSVMESAFATLQVVEQGTRVAFPVFHGERIAGVLGLDRPAAGGTINIGAKLAPVLDSVAVLLAASRSRFEGRMAARAVRLRDRALASITSAVTIIDPAQGCTIIYANAGFEAMSGYPVEEVLGKNYALLNGLETDTAQIASVGEAVADGLELDLTLRNYRRDGTPFWSRVRYSPVKDNSGNVEYIVSVADDVTAKIAADEELLRAKKAAEEHAKTTSRFMANMSHEIRTPMNGVMGMTGLLLDSNLTEEQRDYAETIHNCADGLLAMINEILDFSRVDAGSVQLEALEFDVSQCIESALDLVASAAARKRINLEYLMDPGMPETVVGDLTRVRQILINLLGNAVKFTNEGSVLLSASGSRLESGEWDLHFAVKDTGIGIPPDRVDAVFRPFEQADNSSTRRFGGTGLGLAISRSLVEMMGGRIWVESEVGVGSTFHFTVRAATGSALQLDDPAQWMHSLGGSRVLVLDPNRSSQAVLTQHLEAWGMEVTVLESAGAAAEKARGYDLAIVDNDIPGLSLELVTRLWGESPLVVLCSLGRRDSGLAGELRNHPMPRKKLFSKPIKPSQLCETLANLLSDAPLRVAKTPQHSVSDPGFAARHPFSILVVEDNAVNQKLVLLMLSRMGYRADTANNGLEAVRAVQRQRYDVVFMDMHMPEMDGLEAARVIRELVPSNRQPWIVALTANAMQSDREACLRAGMQHFLTKPMQPNDLREALMNVRQPERETLPEPTGNPSRVDGDWTMPEYLSELLQDDAETATELVDVFRTDTTSQVQELAESVGTNNWDKTKKLLHSLKGSCAQMGATSLAELCQELEHQVVSTGQLPAGSVDRIRSSHVRMLDAVTESLKGVLT